MAKRIENKDVVAPNLFKPAAENAKELLRVITQLEEQLKKMLQAAVDVQNNTQFKGFENLQKREQAVKQAGKAVKDLSQIQRERIKLEEKLTRLNSDQIQKNEELKIQTQNQAKVNKRLAQEKLGLISVYQKESARLNDLRKRYKDVALTQGENSKQALRLGKELRVLDTRLKRIDAAAGQFQRSVGNYANGLRSFSNILAAGGVTLGVAGFFRVVKNGLGIIRDFQKENAVLAGVLNKTRSEITELTNDATRLGSQTVKTSQEVTQLQIAYARLGFSQEDILNLTEPTINGSIALNAGLAETAELTGAVVKSFDDFETTDAPTILDQLTAATQNSALTFEKLQTGLPNVAAAANAAGVPFTRLLALLGKLSDSGIDASKSSTALRNIFIESAAQGLSYDQILVKIQNSTDKLTASNDEFGKRAAVSAVVLSKNIEAAGELDEKIQGAGGTAERVAKEQLATLDGALQLVKSAWQGLFTTLDEGDRVTGILSNTLRFIATNLKTIITVILAAAGAFIAYKVAVFAYNGAIKLYNTLTKIATIVTKGFNKALKISPLGVIVGLLTAVVGGLLLFRKSTDDATESQENLNDELERTRSNLTEIDKLYGRASVGIDVTTGSLEDLRGALDKARKELNTISIDSTILGDVFDENGKKIDENSARYREAAKILVDQRRARVANIINILEKEIEAREKLNQQIIEGDIKTLESLGKELSELQKQFKQTDTEDIERLRRLHQEIELLKQRIEFIKLNATTQEEGFKKLIRSTQQLIDVSNEALEAQRKRLEQNASEILQLGNMEEARRLHNEQLKKIFDEEKERQKEIQEATIETAKLVTDILEKQGKKRQEIIDKEIEANKERVSELKALARQGVENAVDNLAFEQKRQAELARQAEAEKRRQQRLELATATINTYAGKVQAGDENALSSTIRDVALLREFIERLPLFYEGTEDTGKGGSVDSKGGFLSILHPKERVMPADDNMKTGGMSNRELANLAYLYNKGSVVVNENKAKDHTYVKLDEINQTIKNQPVYLGRDYSATERAIIDTIKRGKTIQRNHKRNGSIW